MGKSKIEWTEATWNPLSGCTKISDGCKNCYAEKMANRLKAMGAKGYENGFAVTLHPDRLDEPLKRKKPTMYFVCSMGDLFHEDVPSEFIRKVWIIMIEARQHTFQVLTKRPDRMAEFLKTHAPVRAMTGETYGKDFLPKNIWLGVTAENQEEADKRIPILLDTPAAVRFVSVEPMLEAINLTNIDCSGYYENMKSDCDRYVSVDSLSGIYSLSATDLEHVSGKGFGLNWVIVGGETGANARPMHPDWVRSIKEQCKEEKVPFFFKQWGEFNTLPQGKSVTGYKSHFWEDGRQAVQVGKKQAGHLLDGVEYREMPEDGNEK